jgi:hypothetical protein
MKKMLSLLLAFSFIITACNDNKTKDTITFTDEDGKKKATIDVSDMKDLQKRKEELTNMTPLTADELKALVPAEFMGGVQTDLDVQSAMGATVANADYKMNDSVSAKLDIVDCAGPGGAGLFGMQYLGMISLNSEDDDEYTKSVDFNGGKGIEMCKKKRNRCSFTYFSGDRYMITITGNNTGIDALKEAAKGLDIK